ncbi:MAG: Ig-like domain-containing protein [Prevotellaceae bacterium]|nr:Ig-like domain-containing protein [Prevotellaceae bacterium]
MKKKLSTLIGLLALVVGLAYAAGETEIFSASFNTKPATQSTPDYFTLGEKQNWNAKYTGTYRGVSYSQGLKMESATTVSFTAAKSFKVTIVQSLTANPTKYMKLNDTQFTEADRVDDAANNVGVYTVSNLPAGDYVLTRGNGENGLLFIEVEYLDDSKAPSDLAAVNASKDLPIFGGAYTMTKGVDFTTSSTGAITFESTNSAVATVDADGVVTPVAEGTTNIVISQAADDNYNGGSATITVNDSRTVNDITLEISAATLEIGNTVSVAATSSSTGAITYATSDANIATVDEAGLVTAVGGGTATITVKQEGTDDYKPGETTATIKVLFPDIVLDGNQFILKEGDAGDGRKVIGKDITMTFADGQGKWNVDATKQNYADPTYNYWCAGTQNGNKFSFAPYAKGTLTVAIGLGANKTFHFQKNGTEMTVGTDYTYNLPAAAGEESQVLDGTVPVQVYGTVTAEVEEGAVYTVYCDGSKIGFMGFNFDAQAVPKTLVYPFAEIEGFDAWGSSYTQHVVNYTADGVTVTFESADKNSSTIKDIPVTKGKSVTVEAANEILSVRLVCRQWTTKEQTINVAAGPDKDNLTPLDTQSSNFVLEAPIGNGAKAVQFTFGNTNQIGIDSLYLTLAAGAAPLSVAISPVAGDYYSAQEVTLTPSKALADVFYSFDGENFSRYSEPVNVEEDATIYAKAQLGSEVSEVVTASYRIAKVYESFEELIDVPAEGQPVVVSFNSLTIDSIYTTSKGARNGVYVTVNGKVAEIYAYDVPEEWEAGGRITGTTQGVWKEYNGVKEVCPASWEGITYKGADVNVDKLWNFAEFTDADTVGVDATGTWGGTYDTSKKTSSYKSQAAFEGPVMANATTPFAKMEGLTFKTTAAEALQYRFYTLESVGGYHVYIYDAVEMTVPTDKDKVVRFVAKSYSGEITMGVTGANTSSVAIAYASASNYATYEVVATGDYVTFTLPKNMQIQSIEVCDATPTGISEVKNCIFNDASIYNLRGQKVTNIKAGEVYIVNGKKYLAK